MRNPFGNADQADSRRRPSRLVRLIRRFAWKQSDEGSDGEVRKQRVGELLSTKGRQGSGGGQGIGEQQDTGAWWDTGDHLTQSESGVLERSGLIVR